MFSNKLFTSVSKVDVEVESNPCVCGRRSAIVVVIVLKDEAIDPTVVLSILIHKTVVGSTNALLISLFCLFVYMSVRPSGLWSL